MELICFYEAHSEIWDSRHRDYKDSDKRSMLAIDGEGNEHQQCSGKYITSATR
jgi:hypothetical protein